MLLRMLPEQVANHWESFFRDAIKSTLPPIAGESEEKMNNLLEAILVGGIVVWISYTKREGKATVSGFIVTQIVVDDVSRTKSLLFYSIYAPNGFSEVEWRQGFVGFSQYGKANGCDRITGYSNVEQMFKRVEQFGGDSSYRFLSVPIN